MNDKVKAADAKLGLELARSITQGGGRPVECDATLNAASRAVIAAMLATVTPDTRGYGPVYVGRMKPVGQSVFFAVDNAEQVPTFGGDFVLPAQDRDIARLVLARLGATWKTAAHDVESVLEIKRAVEKAGGVWIFWS